MLSTSQEQPLVRALFSAMPDFCLPCCRNRYCTPGREDKPGDAQASEVILLGSEAPGVERAVRCRVLFCSPSPCKKGVVIIFFVCFAARVGGPDSSMFLTFLLTKMRNVYRDFALLWGTLFLHVAIATDTIIKLSLNLVVEMDLSEAIILKEQVVYSPAPQVTLGCNVCLGGAI